MSLVAGLIKPEKVEAARVQSPRQLSGRSYDAAATDRHNENHWAFADSMDADSVIFAALSTLRNRCRYEIRNNTYAKGIAETLANDLVGTGPTLQISTDDAEFDKDVEDKFNEWAQKCDIAGQLGFADMLRLAGGLQQCESGEAFIVMQSAAKKAPGWPGVSKKEVLIRLQIVEPDRVSTPGDMLGAGIFNDKIRDGIEYDEDGRPAFYYILKKHPGSMYQFSGFGDYDKVPAEFVIHLYHQDRPGQSRGVPRFTPALPLFAQLRRFTLATISAAEQAANITGAIESEPTGNEEDVTVAGEEVEIPRNTFLGLPAGSKINQMKAEHPATTYQMFKNEIINEIARCLNMPFNVAAANSSDYNYASGRLDWQVYHRSIRTDRSWMERIVLNRVFYAWLREAMLIPGYLKYKTNIFVVPAWFWPGSEHVDPVKEAVAQKHRLDNLTTTLADEYAMQGKDWERQLRQRAKEQAVIEELKLKSGVILPEQVQQDLKDDENEDEQNDKKPKADAA